MSPPLYRDSINPDKEDKTNPHDLGDHTHCGSACPLAGQDTRPSPIFDELVAEREREQQTKPKPAPRKTSNSKGRRR